MAKKSTYKSSRSHSKSKARAIATVKATSKNTGILHTFIDTSHWDKIAQDLSKAYQYDMQKNLLQCLPFWHGLNQSKCPSFILIHQVDRPFFRICHSLFDPLSIAGSLADGGRFNIGGAQQISGFTPPISKAGCLYLASSVQTALAELPAEVKKSESFSKFQITANKQLRLWDLAQVVKHFSSQFPALTRSLDAVPMSAAWGLQKIPLESQLLTHYLRGLDGDGLFYPSAKDPSGINYAFFISSDSEAHQKFSITKVL